MKFFIFSSFLFLPFSFLYGQVGLVASSTDVSDGLCLFYPFGQSDVYLIDECGKIVNKWEDTQFNSGPGVSSYITEDGNLLVCKITKSFVNDTIKAGGAGELIELRDWDNNLLWQKKRNNGKSRFHHDAKQLPNGNILAIAWENVSVEKAISLGRKSDLLIENALWPDFLIEYNPKSDSVVWEWHALDHLIQDQNPLLPNYGIIKDFPQLININQISASGQADWMHSNAIDYNEELNIIALSVAHFNEVWFIDRSTSTTEAKSHTGGRFGLGGDLIYRWGNPNAYGQSAQQILGFQHDVQFIKSGKYKDCISVFNNRPDPNYSSGLIFKPQLEPNFKFKKNNEGVFLPINPELRVYHPESKEKLRSGALSSFQVLNNGGFFVHSGNQGYGFELDATGSKIVWQYILPFSLGKPIDKNSLPANNLAFKMQKYPRNFPGFIDKDLSGMDYIELNNTAPCFLVSSDDPVDFKSPYFNESTLIFPQELLNKEYKLFNLDGKLLAKGNTFLDSEIKSISNGIYFIVIDKFSFKVIKS